ncbi:unnamed protein product [Cylicocyclus nassatus]|uniref:Superoxide dismutase [Cu-Zn] n=1 Tax=Cylicocyclus nassatus TaxID=53992 RepID=A0AA36GYR5_CYLNA|nr:unnamed protein product [Cylicocyclus nassatus]
MLVKVSLLLATVHILDCCLFGPDPPGVTRAYAVIYRAVPGGDPVAPIGSVHFMQYGCTVIIAGTIYGLSPGPHGFHVHEVGNLGNGCLAAGPHFNPTNATHGARQDEIRHVGDLGNVVAQNSGVAAFWLRDSVITLTGPNSIVGRSLVIHEGEDDLGRGSHPDSKATGNAGGRFGCGIIVAK